MYRHFFPLLHIMINSKATSDTKGQNKICLDFLTYKILIIPMVNWLVSVCLAWKVMSLTPDKELFNLAVSQIIAVLLERLSLIIKNTYLLWKHLKFVFQMSEENYKNKSKDLAWFFAGSSLSGPHSQLLPGQTMGNAHSTENTSIPIGQLRACLFINIDLIRAMTPIRTGTKKKSSFGGITTGLLRTWCKLTGSFPRTINTRSLLLYPVIFVLLIWYQLRLMGFALISDAGSLNYL